jgi:hypothetical protein
MADLYTILGKAIDTLDPNTKETRRRLYERARAALVAEAGGFDQSETDFLAVLGALEEAIQKLEAEAQAKARAQAQRERRTQRPADAASPAVPRGDIVESSPRRVAPNTRQRFGQFTPFIARALRRGRDGARNLLQRPAERGESLASNLSNQVDFEQARDNWLSDVLARASRPDHENGDGGPYPRRDVRRKR